MCLYLALMLIIWDRFACNWWTTNLHQNARLRGTHDLGFMISPWARKAWELEGDQQAYQTLITAAQTLAARYNATTRCLRSWDTCVTKRYEFSDPKLDFLVIIVSSELPPFIVKDDVLGEGAIR
jgi:hypothetical protein